MCTKLLSINTHTFRGIVYSGHTVIAANRMQVKLPKNSG
jgi:hypothetical protein